MKVENWNSRERAIEWKTTKNGRPHFVPVCDRAAEILDAIQPNEFGFLFPSSVEPGEPMVEQHMRYLISRSGVKHFAPRDLRRTWKTLAGEAGLSKDDRDRLQNHARSDISSIHYDRYEYIEEKRAAVSKWETWVNTHVL